MMSNNINNNKIMINLNDWLDAENSPEEKTRCQTNLIQVMAVRTWYQWQQESIREIVGSPFWPPSGVDFAFQLRDPHRTDIIQMLFMLCTSHKVSPWHKVPVCSGASFSKDPKTFRVRKAISKTPTHLFCEASLFIYCKGNKNKKKLQSFLLRNTFVSQIQIEFCHPKCARKVAGLSRNELQNRTKRLECH